VRKGPRHKIIDKYSIYIHRIKYILLFTKFQKLEMLTKCCRKVSNKLTSNSNFYYVMKFRTTVGSSFRFFMRYILGPLMLTLALFLLSSVFLIFLFFILPDFTTLPLQIFHFSMAIWVLGNILFNYLSCYLVAPGTPAYCEDPGPVLGERTALVDGRTVYYINTKSVKLSRQKSKFSTSLTFQI
jgi:hypothetical protein